MNIKLSFLILLMGLTFTSKAQKVKYREIKDIYNPADYLLDRSKEVFSPELAGVLNAIFPSAGHYYVGEFGRGLAFTGAQIIPMTGFLVGLIGLMSIDENGNSPNFAQPVMISSMFVSLGMYTWSIVDVIQIAKVKNMAFADDHNKFVMKITPQLYPTLCNNSDQLAFGVSLSLSF